MHFSIDALLCTPSGRRLKQSRLCHAVFIQPNRAFRYAADRPSGPSTRLTTDCLQHGINIINITLDIVMGNVHVGQIMIQIIFAHKSPAKKISQVIIAHISPVRNMSHGDLCTEIALSKNVICCLCAQKHRCSQITAAAQIRIYVCATDLFKGQSGNKRALFICIFVSVSALLRLFWPVHK